MNTRCLFLRLAIVGIIAAIASSPERLFAVEIEAEIRAGYGNSDNVGRTETNTIQDDIRMVGFTFNLDEATRRLTAQVRSSLDFVNYASDTFDEDIVGSAQGFATLMLIEDRVEWVLEGIYGQQTFNPFANPGPNNRENVTILSTGPNIEIPFGSQTFANADLRYSTVDYEFSNFDNATNSARLAIGRQLRNSARLSLNGAVRNVDFDDQVALPEYDVTETFIRYEFELNRSRLLLDAGIAKLDTPTDSSDGVMIRFEMARDLTPTSTLTLNAQSQFSDEGNIFQNLQGFRRQVRDTVDAQGRSVPFRSNNVFAAYIMVRPRTRAEFRLGFIDQNYEFGSALDRQTVVADTVLRRTITRELFVRGGLTLRNREYKYVERADDDVIFSVGMGYQFNPAFSISVTYLRFDRDSSSPGGSFTENRGLLLFAYAPPWGRNVLR